MTCSFTCLSSSLLQAGRIDGDQLVVGETGLASTLVERPDFPGTREGG